MLLVKDISPGRGRCIAVMGGGLLICIYGKVRAKCVDYLVPCLVLSRSSCLGGNLENARRLRRSWAILCICVKQRRGKRKTMLVETIDPWRYRKGGFET